jgi:hypothetical protein
MTRNKTNASLVNEGIQGTVTADVIAVGRAAHATKTVTLEHRTTNAGAPGARHSTRDVLFLSYRRADAPDVTGRIYDRLTNELGGNKVFKDVDSIPFGVDFVTYLNTVMRRCTALLVVIGPEWLTAVNPSGQRRLDDPNDFVRVEIESALQSNIPIVPLLVQGAVMPSAQELPWGLRPMTRYNGILIRSDPDFHKDMTRLLNRLASRANQDPRSFGG